MPSGDNAYIFMSVTRATRRAFLRSRSSVPRDFPGTYNRRICMGNGTKSGELVPFDGKGEAGARVPCEYREEERREEKEKKKKERSRRKTSRRLR